LVSHSGERRLPRHSARCEGGRTFLHSALRPGGHPSIFDLRSPIQDLKFRWN
jgi:hypothetical protein